MYFPGEGLAVEGVLDSVGEVVLNVDVGQSDDFVDVGVAVKAALGRLVVVVFGAGTQRSRSLPSRVLPRWFFYVVGIF